ncbi:MAG: RodZ domain-containing protein [Syntrophorhabdales bacterium]|jgi:cytoskeleton protein RodZ
MPFDLARIGQIIRTAREEKGLTLEEASARLFLRRATLGAIESGDWEKLPHLVYVKGYIAQYASFLGVLSLIQPDLKSTDSGPAPKEKRASGPRQAIPMGRSLRKRIFGVAITGGVLFAFLVYMNVQKPPEVVRHSQETVSLSVQNPQRVAAAEPQGGASYNQQQAGPNAGQDDKSSYRAGDNSFQTVAGQDRSEASYDRKQEKVVLSPKKLMIACQERTWVAIMIDGSERKEFTLNPEEVVVLSANEKFDLLIGNAGGVKLYYNGKDVGFSGESGQVKRVTLS